MNPPRHPVGGAREPGWRPRPALGRWRWLIVLGAALYLGNYYLAHRQESAFTGRAQVVDLSMQQEVALGVQSFQQILAQSEVVSHGELPRQVREIAARLIRVGPEVERVLAEQRGTPVRTPWQEFAWDVVVIESPQANAFCLPGGKMAVYSGIVPVAQNVDALAAIIGHEIAHAVLRHGAERMAQQRMVQIGQMAAGLSIADMDPQQQRMVMAALGVGAKFGIVLPFSREHESEADYVGLLLAAWACFDPRAAIGLWQRMGQHSAGRAPPEFASTHPSSTTRIEQLQRWMPEALALREAAGCPPLR